MHMTMVTHMVVCGYRLPSLSRPPVKGDDATPSAAARLLWVPAVILDTVLIGLLQRNSSCEYTWQV